jgi:hypothetical protein
MSAGYSRGSNGQSQRRTPTSDGSIKSINAHAPLVHQSVLRCTEPDLRWSVSDSALITLAALLNYLD